MSIELRPLFLSLFRDCSKEVDSGGLLVALLPPPFGGKHVGDAPRRAPNRTGVETGTGRGASGRACPRRTVGTRGKRHVAPQLPCYRLSFSFRTASPFSFPFSREPSNRELRRAARHPHVDR